MALTGIRVKMLLGRIRKYNLTVFVLQNNLPRSRELQCWYGVRFGISNSECE